MPKEYSVSFICDWCKRRREVKGSSILDLPEKMDEPSEEKLPANQEDILDPNQTTTLNVSVPAMGHLFPKFESWREITILGYLGEGLGKRVLLCPSCIRKLITFLEKSDKGRARLGKEAQCQ